MASSQSVEGGICVADALVTGATRSGTKRRRVSGLHGRFIAQLGALLVSWGAFAQTLAPGGPEPRANAPADTNRPYAQELRSSAAPDLVISLAGSLAISTSASALPAWDPKLVGILGGRAFPAETTVAISDLQTTFIDPVTFSGYPYAWDTAHVYTAPVNVAADLKEHGLSILALANGHALDWGIEGMHATSAALDAAGVKHAGTGDREALARMACFFDEPGGKGRIALLAAGSSYRPTTNALSPHGAAPGRPGISALELMPVQLVPPQQRAELQQLACRFRYPGDAGHCEHLATMPATTDVFGSRFASGAAPSDSHTSRYELNMVQVANELRSVREAKQNSDLAVLSISTGQLDRQPPNTVAPAAALVGLAHASIEAGADLVAVTGQPALGPIEIHRTADGLPRPILYGLGVLYWSPEAIAISDLPAVRDSIIVRSRIEANGVRLEIYPVDLSGASGAEGIPRLADAQRAGAILKRLQELSAPFHTVISIETYGGTVRGVVSASGDAAGAAGGGR
jgi:poly-gamma-glutamate capsule biosynthesis protein CapA/YwtB (metallophosphatase superfamily)